MSNAAAAAGDSSSGRDFNGMSQQQQQRESPQTQQQQQQQQLQAQQQQQQQHSLSSVRSSAEATNIGSSRFGGIAVMGGGPPHGHGHSHGQQQQQQHLPHHHHQPLHHGAGDWAASLHGPGDASLSGFGASMASSLGAPTADPMCIGGARGGGGGSFSAGAILLGGMSGSRGHHHLDSSGSYSMLQPGGGGGHGPGNVNVSGEVIDDGSLSARMLRTMGDAGSSQQQQQADCLSLGDDAILQEMIGSFNAGNAVASGVINAHLLPSSPTSSSHHHRGHQQHGHHQQLHHGHHHHGHHQFAGMEASRAVTDWASLLMDAGVTTSPRGRQQQQQQQHVVGSAPGSSGSDHSHDPGAQAASQVLGMGPNCKPASRGGPLFARSDSGFSERTAKLLFHAAADAQIQGDILGLAGTTTSGHHHHHHHHGGHHQHAPLGLHHHHQHHHQLPGLHHFTGSSSFMDATAAAAGSNFGSSPAAAAAALEAHAAALDDHAAVSQLQADIAAAGAATLLTSNSTRTRLSLVDDAHLAASSGGGGGIPGPLSAAATASTATATATSASAAADNLSDPSRMWRPPSDATGGGGSSSGATGLIRSLSVNSRGSADMAAALDGGGSASSSRLTRQGGGGGGGMMQQLESLCESEVDALDLELEQCPSMSAMLDDLPPPPPSAAGDAGGKRSTTAGFSERKLSRTLSPSVSTLMDRAAALEPATTGTSSACNSVSEPAAVADDTSRADAAAAAAGARDDLSGSAAAEAGGDSSCSGRQESREAAAAAASGSDSQGKKRKDRAAAAATAAVAAAGGGGGGDDSKVPVGKTSATSSRTVPVKDSSKTQQQEEAGAPAAAAGEPSNRSKRSKGSEADAAPTTRSRSGSDNSGESAVVKEHVKPPEAPKPDYIHVRARRGQATDSHSLAERVRREKISERMKYLQDLVPGCSKVTGKAMMLDEIINYVQSLQRQVEFLSMKLQSYNPRMDFSMDSFLPTEARGFTPRGGAAGAGSSGGGGGSQQQQQLMIGSESITIPSPSPAYPQLHPQQQAIAMQQLAVTCGLDMRSLGTQLDTMAGSLRRSTLVSPPSGGSSITMAHSARDPFEESASQVSSVWDGELHSVVQMGYAQNRLSSLASPGLRGSLPPGNMKMER